MHGSGNDKKCLLLCTLSSVSVFYQCLPDSGRSSKCSPAPRAPQSPATTVIVVQCKVTDHKRDSQACMPCIAGRRSRCARQTAMACGGMRREPLWRQNKEAALRSVILTPVEPRVTRQLSLLTWYCPHSHCTVITGEGPTAAGRTQDDVKGDSRTPAAFSAISVTG